MRINKYLYLHVVQGNYGCGWEDLNESESFGEIWSNLKEYRIASPLYNHRLIKRRELNPDHAV